MATRLYTLGSLERALRTLASLEASPGTRLADLARSLDSNPATMLRTLRVLEEYGFVRRDQADGYSLGTRLVELGRSAAVSINVAAELRASLTTLSRRYNITAHIGMLRDGMITVIDKVDPPTPLVRYSTLGTRMPLHATAAGKAALALMNTLGTPLDLSSLAYDSYTPDTIQNPKGLRAAMDLSVQRHFSMESSEYQVGFSCVGTALQVGDDLFTISLSGSQAEAEELIARGMRLATLARTFSQAHLELVRCL